MAKKRLDNNNRTKRRCISQVKMLTSKSYYFQDEIKKNDNNNNNNNNKRKSKSTIAEIKVFMDSERIYVYEGLSIGLNTFLNRLSVHNEINKSIISEKDIHLIFGNYETIYNVNNKLYNDLKELNIYNNGVNIAKLIYGFGQKIIDFIPYFKMYTDYIVHKQNGIQHLEYLKKTNKTFSEFLKINELIAKTKLKLLLEEPAHRIPQYLQYLVNIYTSFKHEIRNDKKGEKLLLQSISDIKKVSDEIAIKCRDLRSRLLVGTLQRDYFSNKIKLLSAHRFCIAYSSVNMLLNDNSKIKCVKFILLNDIFLISTFPSTFKSAQLKGVYPLIGLRISRNKVNKGHKILLLPSNIVIIFQNEYKMEKWIHIISNAVDKQEHATSMVNVIDLEKRIRKQKTSKEGENETISVTNPQRIKAIEKWKKKKKISIPKPHKTVNTVSIKNIKRTKYRRSKTFGAIKQKQKNILSKHVKNNNQKINKVRVMRDEEVLQFDEEIPMENFMKALNSGFVKIRNDEEQNEQYRKAANTAKNLVDSSLQSYRASVFSDHWDSSDSDDDWD